MCTLSIFTRIVRWRVKDFASCFLACRFPLAEEEEEAAETSPPSSYPKETVVLERKEINTTNTASDDKGSENSSRPCFSDEEYIVFCFKEDGAFIVMEDGNKSAEDGESDQGRSSEAEISAAKHRGDGERSNIWWEVEDRPNHRGTVSVESSGSNQSDGSTGSFAFPVLGWEWMGSPVQMPKSQAILNTRKIKPHSLHFQCLRF